MVQLSQNPVPQQCHNSATTVAESVGLSTATVTTTEIFSAEIMEKIIWNLNLFALTTFRQANRTYRDLIDDNWYLVLKILELESQPDSEDRRRLQRLLDLAIPECSSAFYAKNFLYEFGQPSGCSLSSRQLLDSTRDAHGFIPVGNPEITYFDGSGRTEIEPDTLPSIRDTFHEDRDFSISDFSLGQGGHSIVSLGELYLKGDDNTNVRVPVSVAVAVKRAMRFEGRQFDPRYLIELQREINLHGEVKRKGGLAKLSCLFMTEVLSVGKFEVAFPYYRYGDLNGFITRGHLGLNFAHRLLLSRSLLQCMLYLEKIKVLHRDLKASNVLIGDDGILKLGDFALAKLADDKSCVPYGAIIYQSPKILSKMIEIKETRNQTEDHYTLSDEIYSLTLLLYQIFTSLSPYEEFKIHVQNQDLEVFAEYLQSGNKPYMPRSLNVSVRALIERGLDFDENKRPPYKEIQAVLKSEIHEAFKI